MIEEGKKWWIRQGKPVTLTLIALSIVGALAVWSNPAIALWLGYSGNIGAPWTALTYPFAIGSLTSGFGLISLVFMIMWLYSLGGILERELGMQKFILVWTLLTIVPVLLVLPFGKVPLYGSLLPVGGLTVIWATRYPNSPIMLMGMIPLQGKWIGFLSAGIVFFSYGAAGNILVGLFACGSLALAYVFARNMIPFFQYGGSSGGSYTRSKPTKEQIERARAFDGEVRKRKQDREERERLRKLFEGSLEEDDKR